MTISHLHFLPLATFVWLPFTFILTYLIAILLNHVEAEDFPYISDTGTIIPESNVFSHFMNIGVFLVLGSMYVRFKQVQQYYRDHLSSDSAKILKYNLGSFWVGIFSAFGLSLVANYQETSVLEVHLVGAGILFAFGNAYMWIQTLMSFRMHPLLNSIRMARIRLFLTIVATLGFFITAICAGISLRKFHGTNKRKWNPSDGGFTEHLISAISEWIMSLAFDFYFLTYVKEFQQIVMESPKVHFLTSDDDHGLPTSDLYQSGEVDVEITQSQLNNNGQPNNNSSASSGEFATDRRNSKTITAVIH